MVHFKLSLVHFNLIHAKKLALLGEIFPGSKWRTLPKYSGKKILGGGTPLAGKNRHTVFEGLLALGDVFFTIFWTIVETGMYGG